MQVALPSEQVDLLFPSNLQQKRGESAKTRRKIRKDPDKAGEATEISEQLSPGGGRKNNVKWG